MSVLVNFPTTERESESRLNNMVYLAIHRYLWDLNCNLTVFFGNRSAQNRSYKIVIISRIFSVYTNLPSNLFHVIANDSTESIQNYRIGYEIDFIQFRAVLLTLR